MVLLNTTMAEIWHIHGTVVSKKVPASPYFGKAGHRIIQFVLFCGSCEIDFSKRIYRVLLEAVHNVQVSLSHLYGGMAQKA